MKWQLEHIRTEPALKDEIDRLIREGRYPHAVMFYGPSGSPKVRLALSWVSALLCLAADQRRPCGQCRSCRYMEQLMHPDLHCVVPVPSGYAREGEVLKWWSESIVDHPELQLTEWVDILQSRASKRKDAESATGPGTGGARRVRANISAEALLEAMETMYHKSYAGGAKVLFVWMPEYLGKEGNRLLKLVEEPPDDAYIVFVAEKLHPILPTLLSRVWKYRVPPYSREDLLHVLEGSSAQLDHFKGVEGFDGRDYEGVRYFMQRDNLEYLERWMEAIMQGDRLLWRKEADALQRRSTDDILALLKGWLFVLQKGLEWRASGREGAQFLFKERNIIRNFAEKVPLSVLIGMQSVLEQSMVDIRRNVQVRLWYMYFNHEMEALWKGTRRKKMLAE